MKQYTLSMPYYKQGDDLNHFLNEDNSNSAEAFNSAKQLFQLVSREYALLHDYALKGLIKVTNADTHFIGVECSEETAEELINKDIGLHLDKEDEDLDE